MSTPRLLAALWLLATRPIGSAGWQPWKQIPEVARQTVSDYIVVLDAGSTGTRAHAYHYDRRIITSTSEDFVAQKPMSLPRELFYVDETPGVSSYHNDPEGLYWYLTELVMDVCAQLQKADENIVLSIIPVYFGATAGMRALSYESREEVFKIVRRALRDGPLSFAHAAQARVLSGEEESAYGWLMINYYHGMISDDPKTTFGSLDMGGDSAEIAFIPKDPSIMAGLFPMHFGPFPGAIHVYAHSFMDYGLIAAFHRASHWLLGGSNWTRRLEHPCLPHKLEWRVLPGEFGVATGHRPERADGPLQLLGTGDFDRCAKAAEHAISEGPCTLPPCSMLGQYQPSLHGVRFWLTGEFMNIWRILVPPGERMDGARQLEVLRDRATSFCGSDVRNQSALQAEAAASIGASTAEPLLACWLSVWSYVYLTKGIGFHENTTSLLIDTGHGHAWPQGAAIYHVNFYPYRVLLGEAAEKYEKAKAKARKEKDESKRESIMQKLERIKTEKRYKKQKKDIKHEEKKINKVIKKEKKEVKKLERLNHESRRQRPPQACVPASERRHPHAAASARELDEASCRACVPASELDDLGDLDDVDDLGELDDLDDLDELDELDEEDLAAPAAELPAPWALLATLLAGAGLGAAAMRAAVPERTVAAQAPLLGA